MATISVDFGNKRAKTKHRIFTEGICCGTFRQKRPQNKIMLQNLTKSAKISIAKVF